ncbi:MAG: CNNM domain-containing protein [candidate division WOR-3 bacterium]
MIILINLILLILSLFLSFLASGTETAFFTLSEEKALRYPFKKEKKKIIEKILLYPGVIIITIVGTNTLSNTLSSSIFSSITFEVLKLNKDMLIIIDTILFGFIIFIFFETLPKNIALKYPFKFLIYGYPFYRIVIYPFTFVAERIKIRDKKIKVKNFHFLHELELILFTGDVKEILSESEKSLFIKIIEMIELKAKDFKKIENVKEDYLKIDENDTLFYVLKKLLKEKKEFALIDSEGKKEFISKKDLISYVFEDI